MIKPYFEEPYSMLYQGHVLDVLKDMPSESVDMCMTSPPYWGLRSYKTEPQIWGGDKDCVHEWGDLIPNPGAKSGKHGPASCCGSKDAQHSVRKESNQGNFCLLCNAWRGELGLEPKFEMYIDHLIEIFAEVKRVTKHTIWVNIADSYNSTPVGIQVDPKRIIGGEYNYNHKKFLDKRLPPKSLIGIPERFALAMTDRLGLIRRNTVIWYKRNPMPESVKDRFTEDFEYLYMFAKNGKYYFEQQFEAAFDWGTRDRSNFRNGTDDPKLKQHGLNDCNSAEIGRNKRCVWDIPTEPSSLPHYASYPEKLCETPILAGCPKDGIVLDPFAGTGTTGAVAKRLGRKSIGIELSEKYCKLIKERLSKIPVPMELNI